MLIFSFLGVLAYKIIILHNTDTSTTTTNNINDGDINNKINWYNNIKHILCMMNLFTFLNKGLFCVSPCKDGKMDEKTSDFLIRFRSQRPSFRAVGFKSPED